MALDDIKSKCGIFVAHTLHDVYNGLGYLQHRGQDAVGIAAKRRNGIDVLRWKGLVNDFSLETIGTILNGNYILFIGQLRYSTMRGKTNSDLFNGAHPRFLRGKKEDMGSHDIIRGASEAIVHNGNLPEVSYGENEIDTDVMLRFYAENGIEETMKKFPAAYASAILDIKKDEVLVFRDRYGIRPLWIGEKDGKLIASSEDVAIYGIGGRPIREVNPGEVIEIPQSDINIIKQQVVEPNLRLCFFEFNYLQSSSSSLDGRTVLNIRTKLGVETASEFKPNVDFVTYIPSAPKSMARGYSDERGLLFKEIFHKPKKKRSFLSPTKKQRSESIKNNLFVLDNVDLEDKRIVVCDDSLVRLNNAPDAARKLRERGVEYIALVLGTPIIGPIVKGEKRGCLWGVDMPPDDDFAIRRYKNLDGIVKASGFDEVHFISNEAMERAHGVSLDKRCTYCIGGPNPVS